MPMRLSGLMSGMDTESIVSQLVEARKEKVTKAVKAQKTIKYKQDAWKSLNTQILNLYNKSVSNMRFESSFIKKTTKVSNSSIVSVITGDNAMNSVQNLKVTQLAKTGYLTGGELPATIKGTDEDGKEIDVSVTGETTLAQLGMSAGSGGIQVQVGKEVKNITVSDGMTVNSFIRSLREAGVTANFDEANHRIFVAAKSSGEENDFSIRAWNSSGLDALQVLKLNYDTTTNKSLIDKNQEFIDSRDTTLASRLEAQLKAVQADWEKYRGNRAGLLQGLSEDAVKEINKELSSAGLELKDDGAGLKLVKTDGTEVALEDIEDADWDEINMAINKVQEEQLALSENGTLTDEQKQAALDMAASLDGWVKNQSELNATEEKLQIDADGKQQLADDVIADITKQLDDEVEAAKKDIEKLTALANNAETGAKKQEGAGAVIELNGVKYTSSRNTFEINGLTLTVSAETKDEEVVTITTEDDTDGIYDMVRNFIKEYSALINQMDKLYNAESAKGYDPLTDEEKEAMSDSQIEEWENKIKDSILRRDSTLGSFSSELKRIMMEGVEVNGKKMYLSNFGINTLSYFSAAENEKNAYHIDGDPDDESTSGNPDMLKSMIANDPDTVVSFFTQLSQNLYSKMFDMMKGVEGVSSSMTAYEDKRMQSEYDDYTAKIKELEDKLADYEDKWYAKFAAMETALAKMQNNASAVTSLLGG